MRQAQAGNTKSGLGQIVDTVSIRERPAEAMRLHRNFVNIIFKIEAERARSTVSRTVKVASVISGPMSSPGSTASRISAS
jgi:hypothetical protein